MMNEADALCPPEEHRFGSESKPVPTNLPDSNGRQYESPTERRLSILIAGELRPIEPRPREAKLRVDVPDPVWGMSEYSDVTLKPWKPAKTVTHAPRITGQAILVSPVPTTIPSIVTVFGKTEIPSYGKGTTPGRALDAALSRYTRTSLDRNFGTQDDGGLHFDGEDFVTLTGEGFESAESLTMGLPSDEGTWELCDVLRLPVKKQAEGFALIEFVRYYDRASKHDRNMSDAKLAEFIRSEWANRDWEYPELSPLLEWFKYGDTLSEDVPKEVTRFLQNITADQVRARREILKGVEQSDLALLRRKFASVGDTLREMWDFVLAPIVDPKTLISAHK